MDIGIAYDLKSDFSTGGEPTGAPFALARGVTEGSAPDDRLEEYDSPATVDAIAAALAAAGHTPRKIGGGRRFVERVLERRPDLVFNIAEGFGTRSREAHVPSVLEMLGVPFTHSDPLTLAVSLDKAMTKVIVEAAGVPTPAFAVVETAGELARLPVEFPVIAKPLFEGSSMGIRRTSRATSAKELATHVERLLADYGQPVLVEEFCSGPEFTVGILGNGASARPIGVMEIAPTHGSEETFIYSIEVKRNYETEVAYRVPPDRPEPLIEAVLEVALRSYAALACRDVARVDIRVGRDGAPKFLEINPLPGLNPITSDIVILARAVGMSYETLIGRIVEGARARYGI